MCYTPNDRPPDPPGTPAEATGQDLVLTSSDGTQFAAYLAHPASPTTQHTNILIYPDIRGLHQFYKEPPMRKPRMYVDCDMVWVWRWERATLTSEKNVEKVICWTWGMNSKVSSREVIPAVRPK